MPIGRGVQTNVSIEPMLDAPVPYGGAVRDRFDLLGKPNRARACTWERPPNVEASFRQIEAKQTDDQNRAIYQAVKDEPFVRWQDSIKRVVGPKPADEAEMDM
jgi:hypothetical protein